MARMHTRKRGKSGSHKIYDTGRHEWITLSDSEIIDLVVQMKSEKVPNSVIGIKLRDQHAIPSTKSIVGKKIGQILTEKCITDDIPEDLANLIKRYKNVTKHMALNKNDMSNSRGRSLIMAKILRLVKYYKREGRLPAEWNVEKAL